jgi:hypothetical protein
MNENIQWEKKVDWLKLEVGLNKYQFIMSQFKSIERLVEDFYFQTKYKGFYRVRRNSAFCEIYFKFMEDNRNNKAITFEETLIHLYANLGRIEASFASKLIATINPDLPVWDKEVLGNIHSELKFTNLKTNDRINLCVDKYESMKDWYREKLNSSLGQEYIIKFDLRFPNTNLTNLKKIDLILWQTR